MREGTQTRVRGQSCPVDSSVPFTRRQSPFTKEPGSAAAGGRGQVRLGYHGPGRRICPFGGPAACAVVTPHI